MSLNVYLKGDSTPSPVIDYVNEFFKVNGSLQDNAFTHKVLHDIDCAVRVNDYAFLGRDGALVGLRPIDNLSTGTKTLLCIAQYPDKVFSTISCGSNAVSLLRELKEGNVLLEVASADYSKEDACDIVCRGRHFTSFLDFMEFAELTRRGDYED